MNKRWLWLGPVLVAVLVLAAVRADRQHQREATPTLSSLPKMVRTAPVHQGIVRRSLTLQGELQAAESADLAPELTAQVIERRVEPGDAVLAGAILLRLDATALAAETRRFQAEVSAARAEQAAAADALAFQQRTLQRDRTLFDGGAIPEEDLERSELAATRAIAAADAATRRVEALSEGLAAARDRQRKTQITAPWDGAVVAVHLSSGDLARAGLPAVRVVREGSYRAVARVAQEELSEVAVGTPVTLEARGRAMAAQVSRIAAGLDSFGLALLEIDLAAPPFGLPDGAAVEVTLELESGAGLVVPRRALLEGAEGAWVFAVDGERVQQVAIEVLSRGGREVLVRGEISPGTSVVVEHPSVLMTLSSGATVRVAEALDRRNEP